MISDQIRILGSWRSDTADASTVEAYGAASLTFESNGTLRYVIHEAGRDRIIKLTYRLEGKWIITDQPSSPKIQRTEYTFDSNDVLILKSSGIVSRFLRTY